MEITFLGHAGLRLAGSRSSVLVDPWLSPEGAFQASWFQYPENHHLAASASLDVGAVVISHEHLDHLDTWLLSRLPPGVAVWTPRYPIDVVRRKVASVGPDRPVFEVPPWTWAEVAAGIEVLFVPEDSPMNHDAAVVLRADGCVVLNLNDARLSPTQLRAIGPLAGGQVDLLTLQAAGASWHPMCYELPAERRQELSRQKRVAKLRYAARVVKAVEPVLAAPFAGPPCFLDPALQPHNAEMQGGVFPDQGQAANWLSEHGAGPAEVFLPGDTWDPHRRRKVADPRWGGFAFGDPGYLADYALRRSPLLSAVLDLHPEPTASQWPWFRQYFEALLSLSPYFNRRIGMRVGFDIGGPGGGSWAVDFRPGHEAVEADAGQCSYRYRFDGRWLPPLLSGQVPWEDFFLSLRFSAWREPDVHNEHLLGLLKFADKAALDAVEDYETTVGPAERVLVGAAGVTYSVQRRCPHAGADLLEASEVVDGPALRCLNHYYEFDLRSGQCLNGACDRLDSRALTAPVVADGTVRAEVPAPAPSPTPRF